MRLKFVLQAYLRMLMRNVETVVHNCGLLTLLKTERWEIKSVDETFKKVQVGNDQEMAQSERNSHSINRGVGKNSNDT